MSNKENDAAGAIGGILGGAIAIIVMIMMVVGLTVGGFFGFTKFSTYQKISFIVFLIFTLFILIEGLIVDNKNKYLKRYTYKNIKVVENGFKTKKKMIDVDKYYFISASLMLSILAYFIFNVGVYNNKNSERAPNVFKPFFIIIIVASIITCAFSVLKRYRINKQYDESILLQRKLETDLNVTKNLQSISQTDPSRFKEPKHKFLPYCIVCGISGVIFIVLLITNLLN